MTNPQPYGTQPNPAPQNDNERSGWKTLGIVVAILLVLGLIIGVVSYLFYSNYVDGGTSYKGASASSSAASTSEQPLADCGEGGYPVKIDPNKGYNVVSAGVQNSKEDLEAISKDPKTLAYRANNLGLWESKDNWKPLVNDKNTCLSEQGKKVFAMVEGKLTGAGVSVNENGQAPANFFNTGMGENGPVVNPTAGITGDRSAIIYTLADGTRVIVLKRCANLALPSKAGYPEHPIGTGNGGPPPGTTTPPVITTPPTTPPTTTTPVCPPGQHGTPPLCKDGAEAGPAHNPQFPEQQKPNPLPASPNMAQPTRPASPPQTYVPPPATVVVPVPPAQGGPTANPTPRTTPVPEAGAPAPSAPETECYGCS